MENQSVKQQVIKAERKIVWYIIMAIIILVVVFYLGGKFATSSAPANQTQQFNRSGSQPLLKNGNGIFGSVIKKDNQSITIKTRDGSTKIVFISDSTKFLRTIAGSQMDVDKGKEVTITGTENPDGSFNATSVEIR